MRTISLLLIILMIGCAVKPPCTDRKLVLIPMMVGKVMVMQQHWICVERESSVPPFTDIDGKGVSQHE